MSRDLEEFLRMAAARRRTAQGAKVPPMIEPEVVREAEEVVPATLIKPVTPSIKSNIDTSSIQRHASNLGGQITQVEDNIEANIHQKFDHDVGQLDQAQDEPTEAFDLNEEPGDFAKLFSNPDSLRNAIILREILDRPEFDW